MNGTGMDRGGSVSGWLMSSAPCYLGVQGQDGRGSKLLGERAGW